MTDFVSLLFLSMNNLSLSKTWQVLGPFPIGTREQDFGADPLEDYGDILKCSSLVCSLNTAFSFFLRGLPSAQVFLWSKISF